jgi:hypothetical protein
MARNAKDQQQASPEAIERYKASFEMQHDQAKIAHAIATYEETRMSARPKPKFILTAVRSAFELAAVTGGLASIVAVLIVLTAMV